MAPHRKHRKSLLPNFAPHTETVDGERRVPAYRSVPNWARNEIIAWIGEFCGTFMFLFMAFAATQVANANAPATKDSGLTQVPNTNNLMYIALAFGFSLTVNAWAFFRVSGGLFNPAVST